MAADAYIYANFTSFDGTAADTSVECHAIQFGIDLPVIQGGSTRTKGKSIRTGVRLTHRLDKASPKLRMAVLTQSDQGEVVITVKYTVGETLEPAETITLGGVKCEGVWTTTPPLADGSGMSGDVNEVFDLSYTSMTLKDEGSSISGTYSAT